MNVRLADGRNIIIDNYSVAPAAAHPALYTPISDSWPDYMQTEGDKNKLGYLSVGVPGTLLGWSQLVNQYGKLSLSEVMQPAIRFAEEGFRATPYLHDCVGMVADELVRFPETARTFMPAGQPVPAGHLVKQPELADSLRTIAQDGPAVLYGGALGQTIVDDIQKNGGILTLQDLRDYRTIERPVLRGHYRGYEIVVPSPPCSGGLHILQILNLLETLDIAAVGFGTPDMIHLLAECLKIAFTDRAAHVGDPDRAGVPVEWLISANYAAERRAGIDMSNAAIPSPGIPPDVESANTTHVTAADADGNIACLTQTINQIFGSKVTVPGTGIILNDTMALFDPHPGHPNSVASSKRMVSSMSPTIVQKDGAPVMALGTPGGVRIFPAVMQAIVNVIDHGMSLQEAVEAPRVWTQGQELELEEGVPVALHSALTERGHQIMQVAAVAGGMNGVMYHEDGTISGAACWRADGSPMALSGGHSRPGARFRPTVGR